MNAIPTHAYMHADWVYLGTYFIYRETALLVDPTNSSSSSKQWVSLVVGIVPYIQT